MINGKKGISEATIFYIIAVVLGITLVVLYIIFIGPSNFVNSIEKFFGGFESSIFGSLNGTV